MTRIEAVEPDKSSVISEEIRSMIGVELGPKTYKIEQSMITKFTDVIDDPNPLWSDSGYAREKGYDNALVPPTFLINFFSLDQDDWAWQVNCPLPKVLAGGSEVEYFNHVVVGDSITVTGKLVDVQEKMGKGGKLLFLIFERTYKNQRGELVIRVRQTSIRY